jgi:hypothetical protein
MAKILIRLKRPLDGNTARVHRVARGIEAVNREKPLSFVETAKCFPCLDDFSPHDSGEDIHPARAATIVRRRESVLTEIGQCADDSIVTPAYVLLRHADNQFLDLLNCFVIPSTAFMYLLSLLTKNTSPKLLRR